MPFRATRPDPMTFHLKWRQPTCMHPCESLYCAIEESNRSGSMFGVEAFKKSTLGQQVGAILTDPYIVNGMKAFSEHDMTAVQVAGKRLMVLGDEVATDNNKKIIGRWVREIPEKEGLTPVRNG